MKCRMNERKEKGITLIALVITIIVLLILATVSIATLTSDSGILTKARETEEKAKIAEYKERIELASITVASQNDGKVTLDNLIAKICEEKIVSEDSIEKIDNEKAQLTTKERIFIYNTSQ